MNAKRSSIPDRLLEWYDEHRRDLPWRYGPGETPDPYHVWLSEVMLQQTTVATVAPRFIAWLERWPSIKTLAAAADPDVMAAWAGLGYYARVRNLLKTARLLATEHEGRFPVTAAELRKLPGIGEYTAAAIAAIAFHERAVVVDANVERVVARLFALRMPLRAARRAIRAATDTITPSERGGDFAQAMMDLGSTVCTTRAPKCYLCPVVDHCAGHRDGIAERLPLKSSKQPKPHRFGTVFWLERNNHVLLVRRPSNGLLGGMRALPTGPWVDAPPGLHEAPEDAEWYFSDGRVEHGFTHFNLTLALAVGRSSGHQPSGEWWPVTNLDNAGLPTVFAKAVNAIRSSR